MGKLLNKFYSKHKRGFTLFEVLIVVIILGVLALIAVPTYNKLIRKSRVADGLHVLEMLANAQDKYFIENGFYAQNITALKAPFKEIRQPNPEQPFTTIETTNFTYIKKFNTNCIEANSKVGGLYTLIKNYKSKEKVACKGRFCSNLTDYLSEINDEQYATLCPSEYQCTLNQEQCNEEHPGTHFFLDTCSCDCSQNAYNQCLASGGTFHQDGCLCDMTGSCDPAQNNFGSWGAPCDYLGNIPEYEPEKGSTPPESGGDVQATCGQLWNTDICNEETGVWIHTSECKYKGEYCSSLGEGYVLNMKTCQCVKQCPQPQPSVIEVCGVSTHPIEICDPCSSQSQIVPEQPGMRGETGTEVEEHCCGYRDTDGHGIECNLETGEWQCINNNPCIKVEGDIGELCDGTGTEGSQCGIKKFDKCKLNDSFSGAEVITTCELNTAAGNECFDGETRSCTIPGTGESGIEHCVGCHWDSNCVPGGSGCDIPNPICQPGETRPCEDNPEQTETCTDNCEWGGCGNGTNCDGIPQQPILGPNGSQCTMYKQICEKDEVTGEYKWIYNMDEIIFIQPDYECETGWVTPCDDPSDSCDQGNSKGGSYGNGGKGANPDCCDLACQQSCHESCVQGGYWDEDELVQCAYDCVKDHGGACEGNGGEGGNNGGGGSGGGCTPPAQGCPSGYVWDSLMCACVHYHSEPPIGGGNTPTKICQNCKWSCCSHCDFSDRPADYQSQCAYYKTKCWYDFGEAAWVPGLDYYNGSPRYQYDYLLPGSACENGQGGTLCSNGQGIEYCENCQWSCNMYPWHTENITGIVDHERKAYFCSAGITTQIIALGESVCEQSHDTYDTCEPNETTVCQGSKTFIPNCPDNNYAEYCKNHGNGSMCVISGDTTPCPDANCVEKLCRNANPQYWPDHPYTENRTCGRSLTILKCD